MAGRYHTSHVTCRYQHSTHGIIWSDNMLLRWRVESENWGQQPQWPSKQYLSNVSHLVIQINPLDMEKCQGKVRLFFNIVFYFEFSFLCILTMPSRFYILCAYGIKVTFTRLYNSFCAQKINDSVTIRKKH